MSKSSSVQTFLYPAGFLLLGLGLWQAIEGIWDIPRIMLPSPLEIAEVSIQRSDDLLKGTCTTALAALSGFAVALVVGTLLALLFSASRIARRGVYPYMIFLQTVTIKYAFAVARYEVPQNLWEAVMGSNPSKWKGPRNSVEMLSFSAAQDFCRKTTALMRQAKLIEKTEVVRLPSEAEWEYFARAGTTTRYSFGNDPSTLDDYGWYTGNAAGNDPPVGAKKPNPWGLYDIHGYLWEWCLDTGHEDYDNAPTDGSAWIDTAGKTRVLRGTCHAGIGLRLISL